MAGPALIAPFLATMQVTDYDSVGQPRPDDLVKVSAPLSDVLTAEFDGAQRDLGISAAELLLAAVGRAIARTIGAGVVAVDVTGQGRTFDSVALRCATQQDTDATELLLAVKRELAVASHHAVPGAEVLFRYAGSSAEPPCSDHALEIRSYHDGGRMQMDWCSDSRRFAPYTVEELTEQFALGLIELTSEASPPLNLHRSVEFAVSGTDPAITGEPSEEQPRLA